MIRAVRHAWAVFVMAILFGSPAPAQDPGGVPLERHACQRACLEDFVERYLQAMSDGAVSDELFARHVRFTENGVELPLGNEGLWATTVSPEGYRLILPSASIRSRSDTPTGSGASGAPAAELVACSLTVTSAPTCCVSTSGTIRR